MEIQKTVLVIALLVLTSRAWSEAPATEIPMAVSAAKTLYVSVGISGLQASQFMVDTGSSYTTINELTLERLRASGQAHFKRKLNGVLANGDELVVLVYAISKIVIGNRCVLHDVEAAVFPGRTRQILGLNVLAQASPFLFSINPPLLTLNHCDQQLSQEDP